ncbi:MAG: transposase [Gammaproteobacteria bacterium]|nr:transposase [Gammaproteobacteria bacterium]
MVLHRDRGVAALRNGRVSLAGHAYVLTFVTQRRQPVFRSFEAARLLIGKLRDLDVAGQAGTLAFVVMPDHVHWLMRPQTISLADAVRLVKARSSRALCSAFGVAAPLWQAGYYDRAVRREADVAAAARYLIGNPVRAGLVDSHWRYPHWDCAWEISLGELL